MIVKLHAKDMGPAMERNCFYLAFSRRGENAYMTGKRLLYCLAVPLEQGDLLGKIFESRMRSPFVGQKALDISKAGAEIGPDLGPQDIGEQLVPKAEAEIWDILGNSDF